MSVLQDLLNKGDISSLFSGREEAQRALECDGDLCAAASLHNFSLLNEEIIRRAPYFCTGVFCHACPLHEFGKRTRIDFMKILHLSELESIVENHLNGRVV